MNITPAKIASNIELKEPKLFGLPNSFMPLYSNTEPTITASDKSIYENEEFDSKKDVTAYDAEDFFQTQYKYK